MTSKKQKNENSNVDDFDHFHKCMQEFRYHCDMESIKKQSQSLKTQYCFLKQANIHLPFEVCAWGGYMCVPIQLISVIQRYVHTQVPSYGSLFQETIAKITSKSRRNWETQHKIMSKQRRCNVKISITSTSHQTHVQIMSAVCIFYKHTMLCPFKSTLSCVYTGTMYYLYKSTLSCRYEATTSGLQMHNVFLDQKYNLLVQQHIVSQCYKCRMLI